MHAGTPPTERASAAVQLVQRLRLFDATTIIMGSMIGSGIFIVSANMARDLMSPGLLLLPWGITAVTTIVGALSYGELAAAMPHAGGQYVFLREAFGPLFGFLCGWTFFLVIQTGTIAAVVVAFAKFLGIFVPWVSSLRLLLPLPFGDAVTSQHLVALAVVAFLTWINCRGLREGAAVQNIFTVAKVGGLVTLVVAGFVVPANPSAVEANIGNLMQGPFTLVTLSVLGASLVGSLFSSDAWNSVTFTGSEVVNPKRNLPLSLFVGTSLVSLIYLATNLMYLRVLPLEAIAAAPEDRVGTLAAQTIMGSRGMSFVNATILVSIFGCANGLILSGARVNFAMARDRLFFRRAAEVSSRTHTGILADHPGHLGLSPGLERNIQRTARIRDLRAAAFLRSDSQCAVRAAQETPGSRAALQGVRISGASCGIYPARCIRDGRPAVGEAKVHLARADYRSDRRACLFLLAAQGSRD